MKTGDRIFKENKVGRIVSVFDSEKCVVLWDDQTQTYERQDNLRLTPMQEAKDIATRKFNALKELRNWIELYFQLREGESELIVRIALKVCIFASAMFLGYLAAVWIH